MTSNGLSLPSPKEPAALVEARRQLAEIVREHVRICTSGQQQVLQAEQNLATLRRDVLNKVQDSKDRKSEQEARVAQLEAELLVGS